MPLTLADLITEAESVADKAIRENVGPFKWELIKGHVHPITDAMVRDAVARLAPNVLPDLQELLKSSALLHPDLVAKLRTAAAILTEAERS